MSEARQSPGPERIRELAAKARGDGYDSLAAWLEDCAEKEEQADE